MVTLFVDYYNAYILFMCFLFFFHIYIYNKKQHEKPYSLIEKKNFFSCLMHFCIAEFKNLLL